MSINRGHYFSSGKLGDDVYFKIGDGNPGDPTIRGYFHSVFAERLNYKDLNGAEHSIELSKIYY
jgi:hypothetical protein